MAKKILIAGANGGVGEALAGLYMDHDVILTARDKNNLSKLNGEKFSLDVVSEDSIESFVQNIDVDEGLNGFAYCIGSIDLKPFKRSTDDDYMNSFELNVLGAVRLLRKLESALIKGNGSVVLFSTIAVQNGFQNHTIISAAKGALEGLTKSLAADWAGKVRVNAIAPSLTDTNIAKPLTSSDQMREAIAKMHPIPRLGEPDDLAQMAKFLIDDTSSWITGQIFGVDGGRSTLRIKG